MNKTIIILCVALNALSGLALMRMPWGTAGIPGGRPGPRQFPWWGLWTRSLPTVAALATILIASHRFGHIDRFRGGIFFDVPPLWVTPEPYVEVTPVPTCVVLLHEPTGLLSHGALVHRSVDTVYQQA
jgi:hypothetical protein